MCVPGIWTGVPLKGSSMLADGATWEFFICVGFVAWLGFNLIVGFFTGCTSWNSSKYDSTIFTLEGSACSGVFTFLIVCSMIGCFWCCGPGGTTLRGIVLGVALFNIPDIYLSDVVWESPSVINGLSGAQLCRSLIKSCASYMAESLE